MSYTNNLVGAGTVNSGSVFLHQDADLRKLGGDVFSRATVGGTVRLEDGGSLGGFRVLIGRLRGQR